MSFLRISYVYLHCVQQCAHCAMCRVTNQWTNKPVYLSGLRLVRFCVTWLHSGTKIYQLFTVFGGRIFILLCTYTVHVRPGLFVDSLAAEQREFSLALSVVRGGCAVLLPLSLDQLKLCL